ncbi:MAG: FMN-binding glutamate synthase family protein [Euryarchaeota archaeon]|nr:FMN-binding glutamate synthase family protein [Euryarchaeota archaeon]MCG2737144.1 FMN-binding glutamate synthase family protein [Candidatus Methanoperedenaceae archaeon]
MSLTRVNATAATLTKNRTEGSISPLSGMCVTCVDGCIGMCEIGKSAYRGPEVIYPQPFGIITAASEKDYPIDLSHFNILGTAVGAHGIEANSNVAIFPNVDLEVRIGKEKDIKLRLPFIIPGLGSTAVAQNNWDGLAIGSAISGVPLTIGENVCGMDPQSTIEDGKIVDSPELASRIKMYRDWQTDGYGDIILQANVEDTVLGVQEYGLEKLGVETVELKWGQGAKNIGGEVKLNSLENAKLLKNRGYVVLPDPTDPDVEKAYKGGSFHEFERHSRVGMVTEEGFMKRVEVLRDAGAYRPADLARAVKYASKAELDLLTVDGAGGGTGMSPWRMMNEWGVPQVEIYSLLYRYLKKLEDRGEFVPDVAVAGGFSMEDHIYKALAIGAPYFKIAGMARGPLAAAMVGKTIGRKIKEGKVPVYISRFGNSVEEIFITAPELKKTYNGRFADIPPGAIGVYTYFQRLAQGMRQLMTGNRKFALSYIERGDIAALTKEASDVSGIPYIMDVDRDEVEGILNS